ncbi:hypothetical protein PTI98_010547 [Pleurotus ostreatus]|nr:hypothetical protein PTI98_010547 [Pleurotus ostreatus]
MEQRAQCLRPLSSRATSPAPSHSSNKSSLSDQIKQKVSSGFNKVKKVTKALTRPLKKKSRRISDDDNAAYLLF